MPRHIRVDDMANPVLTPVQRAIKRAADSRPVEITMEGVLGAAERRCGLSDFGSDDFRERLRLLIDDYNADDSLSNLGRATLRSDLLRYATNRLLIQEALDRSPQILEEDITEPVIIAGLPRSGTTHLLNLLAADRRFQSLPLWLSQEPVSNPREAGASPLRRAIFRGVDRVLPARARGWLGVERLEPDPRYLRCAGKWAGMRTMVPFLAAMHPMNPDHIHEEIELMGPDFASYVFEWTATVPRFRDHYFASDQEPHYRYMKRVLQLIQFQRGAPKRWVLKCPQHLEQLPVLNRVFPDAKVIFTCRDPVAVLQSTVTMLGYSHRMSRNEVDPGRLLEYWTERIEHLLRAGVRERSSVDSSRSIDVLFHEFMASPEETLDSVYEVIGWDRTDVSRREQAAFRASHLRGKEGRMDYDLVEDFGADVRALRTGYAFYLDAFGVRAEVGNRRRNAGSA